MCVAPTYRNDVRTEEALPTRIEDGPTSFHTGDNVFGFTEEVCCSLRICNDTAMLIYVSDPKRGTGLCT